jgi:hypothetical protein
MAGFGSPINFLELTNVCTYSMVAQFYGELFHEKFPGGLERNIALTHDDFFETQRQVTEMKELLNRAAEYDKKHNQPDCEMEEKLKLLRQVANYVGVHDAVKAS